MTRVQNLLGHKTTGRIGIEGIENTHLWLINSKRSNNEMAAQKWSVSTGSALYSMSWLLGLINCRDDAEGDLAILALYYFRTSGPLAGIQKTNPPRQPRRKGASERPFDFDQKRQSRTCHYNRWPLGVEFCHRSVSRKHTQCRILLAPDMR